MHLLPEGQGHSAGAGHGGEDASAFSQVYICLCGPGGSSASLPGWPHPPLHHGGQIYKMARGRRSPRNGVPAVITSDRGVQFTSSRWSSWCKQVGAKHITTTTFHPQSNGMVERFHRQLKAALKTYGGSLHGKSNFLEPYWDSGQHPRTSLEFPRGRWPWGCNWPS